MAILGAAGAGAGAAGASSAASASAAGASAASAAAASAAASSAAAGAAAGSAAAGSAAAAAAGTAGTLAATSGLSTLFGIGSGTAAGTTTAAEVAGTTLANVSAGINAVGALVSGIESSKSSRTQADLAKANAATANQNAKSAFDVGIQKEEGVRRQSAQQLGAQSAAASESGFVSNSGSMLNTQVQSAGEAELDALQTRYQGILQGQAYTDQATNDELQAKAANSNAGNSLINGVIGAGTAALTGYSQFARLRAGLTGTLIGAQ